MKTDRLTRVNELLRREIGVVLYRLLDRSQFDLAALTVTHVITSSDLRSARVLISIRGHEHERGPFFTVSSTCTAKFRRKSPEPSS